MEAEAGVLKGMEAKCKACAFVCVFSSLCVYVFMESPVWATFQIAYFYFTYLYFLLPYKVCTMACGIHTISS